MTRLGRIVWRLTRSRDASDGSNRDDNSRNTVCDNSAGDNTDDNICGDNNVGNNADDTGDNNTLFRPEMRLRTGGLVKLRGLAE